ncbi:ThuA domain-containing protein [Microbacterium indicum]|uniref:ThuA domain-containing protein n=1 Tax=Microbacterium indicum TaxID=358100 RepID=UPI000410C26F|nr:ThuA domain-containing protein [Microbacterium indicum]
MRAIVAAADGRYRDPWHPFDETTPALAAVLRGAGFDVEVLPVDDALQALGGSALLAVNAGDSWRHDPPPIGAPDAAVSGLDAALARGIGVLAMHTSLSSLRDYPAWPGAVGGMWVPTISMHPPSGDTVIDWAPHPLAGDEPLALHDERYSFMQAFGPRDVVASHTLDGIVHPVVWTRRHGSSRVAVDLLGHDARSYESAPHRALIARLARWASAS